MLRLVNGRYWQDDREITGAEYNELMAIVKAKSRLVRQIMNGDATLDDCPTEWREEIAARVDARQNEPQPEPDASEILAILTGGAT